MAWSTTWIWAGVRGWPVMYFPSALPVVSGLAPVFWVRYCSAYWAHWALSANPPGPAGPAWAVPPEPKNAPPVPPNGSKPRPAPRADWAARACWSCGEPDTNPVAGSIVLVSGAAAAAELAAAADRRLRHQITTSTAARPPAMMPAVDFLTSPTAGSFTVALTRASPARARRRPAGTGPGRC